MSPEDEPDDAGGFLPPLPAEDRLWRHPSELAPPTPEGTPAPTGRRPRRAILVASGLVLVALGAVVAVGAGGSSDSPVEPASVALSPRDEAIAALGPAVARLDARSDGAATTATAVVYRSDGHLLTAADAVTGVTDPVVTLADGRVLPATVVGTDPVSGIAVVRVDAVDLVAAPLQTDGSVEAGTPALAIAHRGDDVTPPVMAEARITGTGWRVDDGDTTRLDLIRTALGTPAETSGALLCSETGAVLGVFLSAKGGTARDPEPETDTAGTTPTTVRADSSEEHYAVPIATAVRAADELVATGRARYGWLGLTGTDPGAEVSPGTPTARVTEVTPGGPAELAGLRPGDLVETVDGAPVRSMSALAEAIRNRRPGDRVTLTVNRDGERLEVTAVLVDRP